MVNKSNKNLYKPFIKEMREKFNKESKKHGNSWKTVEIYKLRCFLKEHVDKWLDNDDSKQEIFDLLDIANYCMMIFNRLK